MPIEVYTYFECDRAVDAKINTELQNLSMVMSTPIIPMGKLIDVTINGEVLKKPQYHKVLSQAKQREVTLLVNGHISCNPCNAQHSGIVAADEINRDPTCQHQDINIDVEPVHDHDMLAVVSFIETFLNNLQNSDRKIKVYLAPSKLVYLQQNAKEYLDRLVDVMRRKSAFALIPAYGNVTQNGGVKVVDTWINFLRGKGVSPCVIFGVNGYEKSNPEVIQELMTSLGRSDRFVLYCISKNSECADPGVLRQIKESLRGMQHHQTTRRQVLQCS